MHLQQIADDQGDHSVPAIAYTRKGIDTMASHVITKIALAGILSMLVLGCGADKPVAPGADDGLSLGTEVQPEWIVLPPPSNPGLAKTTTVSKLIYGTDESLIEINTGYAGGPFGWVSITSNARFQRNSFVGQRYVSMAVNDQYGSADFSPSGTWLKPVIYNITIQGVDLTGVVPSKVKFVYMAPDGKLYPAVYKSLFVELQSGKLQVIDAQLPHFSRYAFGR
jgi:hypothetical protein